MRVELEMRFKAERIWIEGDGNTKIDCMFVPGFQIQDPEEIKTFPTIVFCNPNAGYYEYCFYQVIPISNV